MSELAMLPHAVDASGYRLGTPQRAGALTMVPVFGPAYPGIAPPRSGLKLGRVVTYGQVELHNPGTSGVAIVPLHVGYIQDAAQNHALCRSAFIAAGQTLRFDDACCVQESQGGYLAGRDDQWFFVLPVELRTAALRARGTAQYSKLWSQIGAFNDRYGLPARGHLEQVLTRQRAGLTQYQSRLELLDGQLGAVFLVGGALAGVEIAPDPVYFAEVWMALACFAYGPAAWFSEPVAAGDGEPLRAASVAGLRAELAGRRRAVAGDVRAALARAAWQPGEPVEQERYLDLRLSTVDSGTVAGQYVTDGSRLVYASLFATAAA
ncbi:ARPP-1 family domain-containing protein [Dactylosporangium sp. CA-092794]|uniref:ARPP-1 family domain-containing protein n=1 Tax=Dactylosporangium sp. CA-092794 TaxID=3239929 RepID=UPI003D8D7B12